jgi:hypothetical protein
MVSFNTRLVFINHAATQFDVIHIPWKDAPPTKAAFLASCLEQRCRRQQAGP